jgi:phosphopantetheine adenylyltransferase
VALAFHIIILTEGIVALGKFDALHGGHRELAIQAWKAGAPFLLSFEGIVEVIGWEIDVVGLAIISNSK